MKQKLQSKIILAEYLNKVSNKISLKSRHKKRSFAVRISLVNVNKSAENHCVKSVQIRSYFGSVFFCIGTEYRKILTRYNSVFGHFSRSESVDLLIFTKEILNRFYYYSTILLFYSILYFTIITNRFYQI